MKHNINLSIDKNLISKSKDYARLHGISVSKLVVELSYEAIEKGKPKFSEKWLDDSRLLKIISHDTRN